MASQTLRDIVRLYSLRIHPSVVSGSNSDIALPASHSQHHSPSSTPHWRWPGSQRGRHRDHRESRSVLEEIDFRRALDDFSGAEMRLGT